MTTQSNIHATPQTYHNTFLDPYVASVYNPLLVLSRVLDCVFCFVNTARQQWLSEPLYVWLICPSYVDPQKAVSLDVHMLIMIVDSQMVKL